MNIQRKKNYNGRLKKGEIAGHNWWMSLGLENEDIVIGSSFEKGRVVTDCGRLYSFIEEDEQYFAYTIEDENNDCRKKQN